MTTYLFQYHAMAAVAGGFLLDLLFGDPEGLPHPVQAIGALISALERLLYPETGDAVDERRFFRGLLLAILVPLVTGGLVFLLLDLAGRLHPAVRLLLETLLCWQALALKGLKDAAAKAQSRLLEQDLEGAREAVSMIVGRDTERLTEEGIIKAAVETVAENSSDGVIAPLLYLVLGGPVLGWVYKAVNTMDSMIGYRNTRYLYFGRAAARFDDLLNLVPARFSALVMILASLLPGYDFPGAVRIFLRDRRNHKSPNSAQTESVFAGALGLKLAGDASYFGVVLKKPFIGDERKRPEASDIGRANRLLYAGALLAFLLLMLLKAGLLRLTGSGLPVILGG